MKYPLIFFFFFCVVTTHAQHNSTESKIVNFLTQLKSEKYTNHQLFNLYFNNDNKAGPTVVDGVCFFDIVLNSIKTGLKQINISDLKVTPYSNLPESEKNIMVTSDTKGHDIYVVSDKINKDERINVLTKNGRLVSIMSVKKGDGYMFMRMD